jgi:hypothetical protein
VTIKAVITGEAKCEAGLPRGISLQDTFRSPGGGSVRVERKTVDKLINKSRKRS